MITIRSNPALKSIKELTEADNFTASFVSISDNAGLTSLWGLDRIGFNGSLEIKGNNSLTCLNGLQGMRSVGDDLWIEGNNALISITDLFNLKIVARNLVIAGNPLLGCLSGLSSLDFLGRDLVIENNLALTSLAGPAKLGRVGRTLRISGNLALTNLYGLQTIRSVGNQIVISGNPVLLNLTGLEGLDSINGVMIIQDNPALTSLKVLESVGMSGVTSLTIRRNPMLGLCAVKSICELLADPGATILAENNSEGCNSREEIANACDTLSIGHPQMDPGITIFPNPVCGAMTIELNGSRADVCMTILDTRGNILYERILREPVTRVDPGHLPPGVYLVKFVYDKGVVTRKLIKQ
jgi:hypothetical protein